jgi:predicted TIM-barrel fold metal-dependent hydrolase
MATVTMAQPTASAGTGTPEQRLREQDQDGIEGEILFSQLNPVLRQAKDDELYLELVRAYNEFLAKDYMAVAPERLIPTGLIPLTGVDDAIRELEHCTKLGLKGVKLDKFPRGKSYPTPNDDKFWAAAIDLGMPLTNHNTGRFGSGKDEPAFLYESEPVPDVHQR